MQAHVLSVPLSSGNLQADINTVLAQSASGYTNWRIASSFATSTTAFVIFVREQIPAAGGSPYVTS